MYTNFAAQFAPEVALPPYGEFDTPEPEAGLAPPEHLYDSRGNPLNYIQTEGGPREFLVPRGQAVFAAPPTADNPQAPVRLRGRAQQTPDYPLGANTDPQPQDLMRPQQPGTRFGQRATLPIPPSPSQIVASGAIQQRQTEDQVIGAAFDQRAMRNARNPVGSIQDEFNAGTAGGLGTLQRLIQESGFGEQLSNFISQLQGRAPDGPGRRRAPGAEMESELRGMSNPHNELSMVDTPPGNVVPVSAEYGRAQNYNGRAQEVYDLLVSRGIRLGPNAGVRHSNALTGGHPAGNSIDVPPGQYEEAIAIIRERYPNMPLQPIFIRRGQRFRGGVVSTGDHYHIDMGDAALN